MVVAAILIVILVAVVVTLATFGRRNDQPRRVRDSPRARSSGEKRLRIAAAVGVVSFVAMTVTVWPAISLIATDRAADFGLSTTRTVAFVVIAALTLITFAGLATAGRRAH